MEEEEWNYSDTEKLESNSKKLNLKLNILVRTKKEADLPSKN